MRDHSEPPVTDMSMAAWPSSTPTRPLSACSRASRTICGRSRARNSRASSTIISGPPTNSAAVNCQPSSTARMMPSSTTRLVEANWNAIALVKSAPLRNTERAIATAAYEQEEEAAPSPQAIVRERGESSGSSRPISALDTTAWTAPEIAKPRVSAQRISHAMAAARLSAWPSASSTIMCVSRPVVSVVTSGSRQWAPTRHRRWAWPREPTGILLRSVRESWSGRNNASGERAGATSRQDRARRGGAPCGLLAAGRRPGSCARPGGRQQPPGRRADRPRPGRAARGLLRGGAAARARADPAGPEWRPGPSRPGPPSRRAPRGAGRHPPDPRRRVLPGRLADRLRRRLPPRGRLLRVCRRDRLRPGHQPRPVAAPDPLASGWPLAGDGRGARAGRGRRRRPGHLAPARADRARRAPLVGLDGGGRRGRLRRAGLAGGFRRGRRLLVELVLLGATAALVWWPVRNGRRPGLGALALAAGAVVTMALGAHDTGLAPRWLFLPLEVVHLLAVGAWIGGLVVLALTARRAKLEAVRRFSVLALRAVLVVAVTGIWQGLAQVSSRAALTGTDYGRVLAVKAAGFLAVLSLAAVARFRLLPRASADAVAGGTPGGLRRLLAIEATGGAVVVLVAALLANTVPAGEVLAAASAARVRGGVQAQQLEAGPLRLQVGLEPGTVGRNLLQVQVTDPSGRLVDGLARIDLTIADQAGRAAPASVRATRVAPATYRAATDAFALPGA